MAVIDHPTRTRRVTGGAKPKPKPRRTAPAGGSSTVTKASLLKKYDGLVDAIERSAARETWRLGEWLAANVPNDGPGRPPLNRSQPRITIAELVEHGHHSERWLQTLRAGAEHWPKEKRVPGASLSAHELAFSKYKDVDAARKSLLRGQKVRDQGGAKQSVAATKRVVSELSKDDKAAIAADLQNDPAERPESDFETLREILWIDLDEARSLVAVLGELDETQSRSLRERATELREVANWLDDSAKAAA